MNATDRLLTQMLSQADTWERQGDQRYVFQRCYGMMSSNMADAIANGRFADELWVEKLMQRFAGYYFNALAQYEQDHSSAPAVWQQAHDAAKNKNLHILQHLLLGINAHINYDLPLALYDGLHTEWPKLGEADRRIRKSDHETVNAVIAETIDSVQDTVIEPRAPAMAIVDRLMGRMDEWLISQLISAWRADVWHVTLDLLAANDAGQREDIRQTQEKRVLERGKELKLEDFI